MVGTPKETEEDLEEKKWDERFLSTEYFIMKEGGENYYQGTPDARSGTNKHNTPCPHDGKSTLGVLTQSAAAEKIVNGS